VTRASERTGLDVRPPTVNGDPCPSAAHRTVEDLVATLLGSAGLGVPASGPPAPAGAASAGVAVAVNDSVVPRGLWGSTSVRPGDRVEVVTAVQGG
jgi:sulfur carrier protein